MCADLVALEIVVKHELESDGLSVTMCISFGTLKRGNLPPQGSGKGRVQSTLPRLHLVGFYSVCCCCSVAEDNHYIK